MQLLKRFFNFYIDSNLHVAIAGASFTAVSLYYFNSSEFTLFPLFVFFSTILGYHFIRVFENYESDTDAVFSFLNKQSHVVLSLSIIALLGVLYIGLLIGISKLWILVPAVIITFFYAIPIVSYKGKKVSFRNFPKLKLISIALAWAITTVLFPLAEQLTELAVWILFLQRFFLIMVLVIPFDIRDLKSDALHLQTLPQQIGIRNTKKIGILFLVVFILLSLFQYGFEKKNFISDSMILLISLFFLVKSNAKQPTYFASFWVEAIPIFWIIQICLFTYYLS